MINEKQRQLPKSKFSKLFASNKYAFQLKKKKKKKNEKSETSRKGWNAQLYVTSEITTRRNGHDRLSIIDPLDPSE